VLLEIIWKRLYKTSSCIDQGTLYQLRNLVNRRNVVSDPHKDVNACEDFLLLVVKCHVVCATMKYLNMDNVEDFPEGIEENWSVTSIEERRQKL
jgi:hypothetical protein